ncbi:MAG: hypothetical protein WKG07_01490 [Hymenobacter sp.]
MPAAGWWSQQAGRFSSAASSLTVGGIRNLDLQVEFNYVRPYTYQHENLYTAYEHYQQPLAHPMGANLVEIAGRAQLPTPTPPDAWWARRSTPSRASDFTYSPVGQPIPNSNYGCNPLQVLRQPATRHYGQPRQYGYRVGDGNTSHALPRRPDGHLPAAPQPVRGCQAHRARNQRSISHGLPQRPNGSTEVYAVAGPALEHCPAPARILIADCMQMKARISRMSLPRMLAPVAVSEPW